MGGDRVRNKPFSIIVTLRKVVDISFFKEEVKKHFGLNPNDRLQCMRAMRPKETNTPAKIAFNDVLDQYVADCCKILNVDLTVKSTDPQFPMPENLVLPPTQHAASISSPCFSVEESEDESEESQAQCDGSHAADSSVHPDGSTVAEDEGKAGRPLRKRKVACLYSDSESEGAASGVPCEAVVPASATNFMRDGSGASSGDGLILPATPPVAPQKPRRQQQHLSEVAVRDNSSPHNEGGVPANNTGQCPYSEIKRV
jgi:hypothetical protein